MRKHIQSEISRSVRTQVKAAMFSSDCHQSPAPTRGPTPPRSPHTGPDNWGMATAVITLVYLIKTLWLQVLVSFSWALTQLQCLPGDAGAAEVPRMSRGWHSPFTPWQRKGRALHGAATAAPRSAVAARDAAATAPSTRRSAAPLHETALQQQKMGGKKKLIRHTG